MTLEQKMDDFKAQFESGGPPYNAPKAVIEVFHRATEDLRRSGLAERALKTGERAPAFTLNNQDGNSISNTSHVIALQRRRNRRDHHECRAQHVTNYFNNAVQTEIDFPKIHLKKAT
jgi:hypothetical protein